jgi:hypothetical protein
MSSGAKGLEVLAQERDHILQAELGALLHNLGKLSQAFLSYQRCKTCQENNLPVRPEDQVYANFNYQAIAGLVAEYITAPGTALTQQDWNRLESSAADWLEPTTNRLLPENIRQLFQKRNIKLSSPLDDRRYAIGDFIEFQAYKWYEPKPSGRRIDVIFPGGSKATELLEISHDAASGAEKEGSTTGLGGQPQLPTYWATVFGYELPIDESQLESVRRTLIEAVPIGRRTEIWQIARNQFVSGVVDTRRTINDVTLWDLSSSVAGFYKAAVARVVLDNAWVSRNLFEWRILRILFDGLAFLQKNPTITDLLGRQEALQDALDRVKELLEVTYPLGNEIYRDENGSAFVVPALEGDDQRGSKLLSLVETLIRDAFRQSKLEGEIEPRVSVSEPSRRAEKLHQLLQEMPPPTSAFVDALRCWWHTEPADACTACGLRPQGWGAPSVYHRRKAEGRNVCFICLERRGERAKEWARARHGKTEKERKPWQRTIWLDEIADNNGRLALLVGRFDLSQWLNGKMVQTLLVASDPPNNTFESKNPSFARLQRVWRTTQQFWQDIQDKDIPSVVGLQKQRLAITVTNVEELKEKLGKYHVYETEIEGQRLPVVWDDESEHLLTAENLEVWTGNSNGAVTLRNRLPAELPLFDPGGYGQKRTPLTTAQIDKSKCEEITLPYSPAIALLAEPQIFMALVPATAALEVTKRVAERYELEMSKVRNRLPLFLGLVFFDRRQPLFSALDAGRRLLKLSLSTIECAVQDNKQRTQNDAQDYLRHPHFNKWQELKLKTGSGEDLIWRISTVMGDGKTPDEWYPYYCVGQGPKVHPSPTSRRYFKLIKQNDGSFQTISGNDSNNGADPAAATQWVHVEDIQPNDAVQVTPACFSCLYLDASARRFEAGKKTWLLDQIDEMIQLWNDLKHKARARDSKLTDTTLRAIATLFKTKWELWKLDERPTPNATDAEKADYQQRLQAFKQLVRTTLEREKLAEIIEPEQVTNGLFFATLELYVRIMKERLAMEPQRQEQSVEVQR